MAPELSLDNTVTISSDILDSTIDDEVVLLSIEAGKYFGLDAIASEIWKKLQEPTSVRQIIDELQDVYKVDPEQCEADTLQLLREMVQQKLIIINEC